MKTRLMHVQANVSDLEKSISWYKEVLGFEVGGSWPKDKPNYAHFELEQGAIFSIAEQQGELLGGRFNFSVQHVDELWESLKDKAEVLESIFDTPYGTRKFTIRDLDGNQLGFVELK